MEVSGLTLYNRQYVALIIECVLHYSLFLGFVTACILFHCCRNLIKKSNDHLRVALQNERFIGGGGQSATETEVLH